MTPPDLLAAFDMVAEAPDGVALLRDLVLRLAVRGRLVRQEHRDASASVLLGGRAITNCAAPFELPSGWSWTSLKHLGEVRGGGTPSKSKAQLWAGPIPWVSPKDMKVPVITDARDHVSEEALTESAVKLIPPHSILMVVRGMILAHSFPVAVTAQPVTINQDMKAITPFDNDVVPYAYVALRGSRDRVLAFVERSTHGTCRLAWDKLASMPIGFPPLAEQRRIVAKVDALMAMCDALEARLTVARDLHAKFAAAAVHHLDLVAGSEPMSVPGDNTVPPDVAAASAGRSPLHGSSS